MLSTNEKVPTVPPKITTMHDYFKPDAKKAADNKQGRRLKKQKSIANESIDFDRGRPSKSHHHAANRSARGLTPKLKDTVRPTKVGNAVMAEIIRLIPNLNFHLGLGNRQNHKTP